MVLCQNLSPSLPPFTGVVPIVQDSWTWGVLTPDKRRLDRILPVFHKRVSQRITGARLLQEFFSRRFQPAKQRAHGMFQYSGPQDSTRERPEEPPNSEAHARVQSYLAGGADAVLRGQPPWPFILTTLPTWLVTHLVLSFHDFLLS